MMKGSHLRAFCFFIQVSVVNFYIWTKWFELLNRQSEKINANLLTSLIVCDIFDTIFLNAMKKLFFTHSFFQRAVGWCEAVETDEKVSFWSRIAEVIKRLRFAPLPWQRACWSLIELTDFSVNRVVPRYFRP